MKTTIITAILSIMTGSLIAQTREYYRNGNILKCTGIEYSVVKEDNRILTKIMEKDNYGKDFSNRTKDGKSIDLGSSTYTCDVVNREMIHPTIKRIVNKYGLDIYDRDTQGNLMNVPPDDHFMNMVATIIYFTVSTQKVEHILFLLPEIDGAKALQVPIEAYDEINKELKRVLACIPNDTGKQLIYCHVSYNFVLK